MSVDIEKIKHRIRSLLARNVQNGASVAEAETCLEKAYNLLTEFNLDIEELLQDTDPNTKKVVKEEIYESGNISPELWELYAQVAWLFHCEAIRSRKKQAGYKYRKVFINIIGNPINVEKVKYFMNLFIETAQQIIKNEEITGLRNINSFKRGFYLAIAQKAQTLRINTEEQEKQEEKSIGTSLMILDKKNVEDFIAEQYTNLHRYTNNFNNYGKQTSKDMYGKGINHGSAMDFNDPISEGINRRISCQ